MGAKTEFLSRADIEFIEQQKMFFVATAASDGKINLSPKGLNTLRVSDEKTIHWINLTGSGNETAAHSLTDGRITLMFCSFDERPLILRVYGRSSFQYLKEPNADTLSELGFESLPGARQLFRIDIELVQKSCGFGVPRYEFLNERETLREWAVKKGASGIEQYQREKNGISLDGFPTGLANE